MSNSNNPLSVAQASLQRWYPSNAENTAFHLQQIYTALNDHNLAIISINNKGGSGTGSQTGTTGTSGPSSITINNTSSLGGLGRVNLQSADYTLTNDDAGGLVLVNAASPVTIICASAVTTPFFCFIQNDGTADVTLTPDGGLLINGGASLTVKPAFFVVLFFVNGVAWDAATLPETTLLLETNGTPNSTQTLLNLAAGTNITLTESAGTVTIAATGGGGGADRGPLQSNANGRWWVWTDGVIEQFGSLTVPSTGNEQATALVTFPTPFTSQVFAFEAYVVGLPRSGSTRTASVQSSTVGLTTSGLNLQCNVPTGGGGATFDQDVVVQWRAIGI